MGDTVFRRGFQASRDEKARQEQVRENLGKRLFRFFLTKDGEEADVVFITKEPINYDAHTTQENGRYVEYTCGHSVGRDCPFCDSGVKTSFRGAFLVYDKRPFEVTDRNTQKKRTVEGSVKIYTPGVRVVSQLDRLNTKYGLAFRECTISRSGTGTATTYIVEKGDRVNLSEKEIREMLPDKLRDEFDGSEDSLYSIVEEQVKLNVRGGAGDTISNGSSSSIGDEDSYDGADRVIGMNPPEEQHEEKKGGLRRKSGGSMFRRRVENSLKNRKDIFREGLGGPLPFD